MSPGESVTGEAAPPGVAAERTSLAWTRSALSLAAVAGLLVRYTTEREAYAIGYPAAASMALLGAFVWAYGSLRFRDGAADLRLGGVMVRKELAIGLMAGGTALSAVAAVAIGLYPAP